MAGSGSARRRVDRLVGLLGERRFEVEVLADLAEVSALANRWCAEGRLRALVGVGGDGTAAELVNRTATGVPLTMLPAGTANHLSRYLGWNDEARMVCRTIGAGTLHRLDAGMASGRVFLLMASCGFDADVVRRVHGHRKGHISYWTYLRPILKSIRSYGYPEIRVYCDEASDGSALEQSSPIVVRWAFAMNLPRYGWGLTLAPKADPTDGLLDLCTFRRGSLWHGLRYAWAAQLGRHQRMADCTTGRMRRLRIRSREQVPYQLDGDPGGFLPVDIEVLPGRMTVLVPPED